MASGVAWTGTMLAPAWQADDQLVTVVVAPHPAAHEPFLQAGEVDPMPHEQVDQRIAVEEVSQCGEVFRGQRADVRGAEHGHLPLLDWATE